ncbi:MAG: c-type cytochrome [Myxococcota bacterium]
MTALHRSRRLFIALALSTAWAKAAIADEAPLLVGDPLHGAMLYAKHCAVCHGKEGTGGPRKAPLTDAARMNLLLDDQLFAIVRQGQGLSKPSAHAFKKKLAFLMLWDVVAHLRTQHMRLDSFFPDSSRYISKIYTLDENGLKRIEAATGHRPTNTKAAVFTFFDFEGERGNLTFVPQDPIQLGKLKKDNKAGYLVFLPFETNGYADGEIGIAMDARGVITKAAVRDQPGGQVVNRRLAALIGQGRLGQKKPFKVGGPRSTRALAAQVFPVYLRAMETVTRYIVEERERTWADDALR